MPAILLHRRVRQVQFAKLLSGHGARIRQRKVFAIDFEVETVYTFLKLGMLCTL